MTAHSETTGGKRIRCPWAVTGLSIPYHDTEWGVPQHDDRILFEFLILEGAQAGLSWETILRKRSRYREVFDGFHPERVALYGPEKIGILMQDPGIIRNRRKIEAAVGNARTFLEVQAAFGSFDAYIWRFVEGEPRRNSWKRMEQVPCRSPEADAMSRDMKSRGFRFVGPLICYAFMQAVGMVNDHLTSCFRYDEVIG